MTKDLPVLPFKRILRKNGADRVSQDAAEIMAEIIEKHAEELAEEAALLADHADRKTVKQEDVESAPLAQDI